MISDAKVEEALDFMIENAEVCGKWKAERVYLTDYQKVIKADLMNESAGTTSAEREQYAYSHEKYAQHLKDKRHAVSLDAKNEFLMRGYEATIDAWRTQQSNQRSMGKIQ